MKLKKYKAMMLVTLIILGLVLISKITPKFDEGQLLILTQEIYSKYGLLPLFLAALVEATLFIGWYLPGSFVIFTGMVLASNDPYLATKSVVVIMPGLNIGYLIDYLLGRFGWYTLLAKLGTSQVIESTKKRVHAHMIKTIFLTYWQPNLATLVATSAGILRVPFKDFFLWSLAGCTVWSIFWGYTSYFLGKVIIQYLGVIFISTIFLWLILNIVRRNRRQITVTP